MDTTYKIIDWELSLKLACDKEELARDLLQMLVKDLPEETKKIQHAFESSALDELYELTHKLHGALCYCGATRLKNATAELESLLRNSEPPNALEAAVKQIQLEARQVLEEAPAYLS